MKRKRKQIRKRENKWKKRGKEREKNREKRDEKEEKRKEKRKHAKWGINMSMHLTRKTKLMQEILLRGKKIDERGKKKENKENEY